MHSVIAASAPSLLSLSPARLWDADHGIPGSPVSAWASRVGGSSATQATGVNQPTGPAIASRLRNRLALDFDGTDRLRDSADLDCSAAWTVVRVFDLDALKNEHGLFHLAASESSGGGGVCCYAVLDGRLVVGSASTSWYRVITPGLAANSAYALLASCSGTSASLSVELGLISGGTITWTAQTLGALSGTFAMPAATTERVVVGGGWSSSSSFLSGRSAVEAWWTRVLSAGEVSLLKSILRREYA